MLRLCSCSLAAALALSASASVAATPPTTNVAAPVHSAKAAVTVARLEEEGGVVTPEVNAIFNLESKNAPRIHWDLVLVG
ncbi:MAG TPA: hypothetical protein VGG12_08525 [Methylovirgula sp.]